LEPGIVHNALQESAYQPPQRPTVPQIVMEPTGSPMPPARSPMTAIHARIRRYNSDIEPGSDTYRSAVLLLAGLEYGQNIDMLARRAGIDRSFVAKAARRLIDNGVWVGGRTVSEWTALDEASGAFWNDVAVGEGKLCRRTLPDGTIEWAPPGFWNKGYHFVDHELGSSINTVYFDPGERTADTVPLAVERIGSDDETAETAPPAPDASATTASADPQPAENPSAGNSPPPAGSDETEDREPQPPPPSLNEIFSDAVWIR
jgi:hypothetical protein